MEKTKHSLTNPLLERFNSVFFATYLLYVVIINWKAFVYLINPSLIPKEKLLTETGTLSKLDFIETLFTLNSILLIPLGLAALSILILPFLNAGVKIYKRWIEILGENRVKRMELDKLLRNQEDYKALYMEQENLKKEYDEAITNYKRAREAHDTAIKNKELLEEKVNINNQEIENLKRSEKILKDISDKNLEQLKATQKALLSIKRIIIFFNKELEEFTNILDGETRKLLKEKEHELLKKVIGKHINILQPEIQNIQRQINLVPVPVDMEHEIMGKAYPNRPSA